MAKKIIQHCIGKRKTAVARAYLREGKGVVVINHRPMDEYYLRPTSKMIIMQPLEMTGNASKYDVSVTVCGGGLAGQAEAIRHAISRALAIVNPDNRPVLKKAGLLTRDARKKERKLPGQPAARARYQFSKR